MITTSLLNSISPSIRSGSPLQVCFYLLFLQRPRSRLPRHWLLTGPKPYVSRELLAQHIHDGRHDGQDREQSRVADQCHQ